MDKKLHDVIVETVRSDKYFLFVWCDEDDADNIEDLEGVAHVTTTGVDNRYGVTIDHRYDVDLIIRNIRKLDTRGEYDYPLYSISYKVVEKGLLDEADELLKDMKDYQKQITEKKLEQLEKELKEGFLKGYRDPILVQPYMEEPLVVWHKHYKPMKTAAKENAVNQWNSFLVRWWHEDDPSWIATYLKACEEKKSKGEK